LPPWRETRGSWKIWSRGCSGWHSTISWLTLFEKMSDSDDMQIAVLPHDVTGEETE
jgi:hypothetical protein